MTELHIADSHYICAIFSASSQVYMLKAVHVTAQAYMLFDASAFTKQHFNHASELASVGVYDVGARWYCVHGLLTLFSSMRQIQPLQLDLTTNISILAYFKQCPFLCSCCKTLVGGGLRGPISYAAGRTCCQADKPLDMTSRYKYCSTVC